MAVIIKITVFLYVMQYSLEDFTNILEVPLFILFFMTSSISWVIFTCLDYSKNNKMNEWMNEWMNGGNRFLQNAVQPWQSKLIRALVCSDCKIIQFASFQIKNSNLLVKLFKRFMNIFLCKQLEPADTGLHVGLWASSNQVTSFTT
jgi:hypothetical protein